MLLRNHGQQIIGIHCKDGLQRMIQPGGSVQSIKKEDWAQFKGNQVVAGWLRDGIITIEREESDGIESTQSDSLESFDTAKALELASATSDRKLLEFWKSEEKRPEVLEAIEAQLKVTDPKVRELDPTKSKIKGRG